MSIPTFSVIMPTYNHVNFITRAVDSVLAQSFADFELLIVDDGSTDNTRDIVTLFSDSRIHYVYQENQGVSAARNAGAALARGKYLTFLDSDDEALAFWLQAYALKFAENEAVAIVCSGCRFSSGYISRPVNMGPLYDNQVGLFLAGTFAVERELFELAGGYVESLRYGENAELALRLVKMCTAQGKTIASLAIPLSLYHNREAGKVKDRRFAGRLENAEYMLQVHQEMLEAFPEELSKYYEIAGINASRIGKGSMARRYFLKAITHNPTRLRNYMRLLVSFFPFLVQKFWVELTAYRVRK